MENSAEDNRSNDLAETVASPAEGQRAVVLKAAHVHKIGVGKPKSNLHFVLAIVCGLIIGLIATLLLELIGGRFI